jgi:hypothetical protein
MNSFDENFARSIFSAMAALKIVSKCSFTTCKLRFFDYFCLAMTKNLHRAKLSYYIPGNKKAVSEDTALSNIPNPYRASSV